MDVVCVFCEGIYAPDTVICHNCEDYKGIMPMDKAEAYLGIKFEEN